MDSIRDHARDSERQGLIVYWPGRSGGLWDETVSKMIEELEGKLGVYVTSAEPSGGGPSLGDAAAAAKFMGCSNIVVVSAVDRCPTRRELSAIDQAGLQATLLATPVWSAAEVARSFRSVADRRPMAA